MDKITKKVAKEIDEALKGCITTIELAIKILVKEIADAYLKLFLDEEDNDG